MPPAINLYQIVNFSGYNDSYCNDNDSEEELTSLNKNLEEFALQVLYIF